MEIDQAGNHVQSRRVGHAPGARRVDRARHLGNLVAGDRDVHRAIDPVLRIDHVSVLDDEIERRALGGKQHHRKIREIGEKSLSL